MKAFGIAAVLVAAACVAATCVAAWSPVAGGQNTDVRINCKGKAIDIYFWPHGRPKVKAYKFTAYPQPHLTVYKKGTFASRGFFMFLSATSYNYANTCVSAPNPIGTRWGGGPKTTITATRRVRCTFPGLVQMKMLPAGGKAGGKFVVARGVTPKELVSARVKAKGSTLIYDSRYCKATKVPGVS